MREELAKTWEAERRRFKGTCQIAENGALVTLGESHSSDTPPAKSRPRQVLY